LAAAYDAWLANLADIPVLTIDSDALDFLAHTDDLTHVIALITQALAEQKVTYWPTAERQMRLLQEGRLAAYQQFHHQLDESKGFDPDLFFNYILLTEEVGEVAKELIKIWGDSKQLSQNGRSLADAHQEALSKHRPALRNELADLLAYILKLANYTGIDLEQAYLEKMGHNIGRDWPSERTLPSAKSNKTQSD
jgi:NTP pyrophosphatase (non-canonical NTP hydrolase)